MNRSKTDPSEPEPTTTTPGDAPATTVTETADQSSDNLCEPFPGEAFFHGGRHSPIVTAMARRLEQEDCTDNRHLGPDWTNAHRDAFAAWQRQLRPKGAGDVSGIPDETAWDRLKVPRVSTLPKES